MEYFIGRLNQLRDTKTMSILLFCTMLFATACNNDTTTDKAGQQDTTNSAKQTKDKPDATITAATIDYKKLADAYCTCAEHTVSINSKLKALLGSDDTAAFEALLPEADKAFKDAMECCRNAKFEQTTEAVDQKKLFKPLKKTCPDLPEQLMLKMVTAIK